MKTSERKILNFLELDLECRERIVAGFDKHSFDDPLEVADIVGIVSLPDIARYLNVSGHAVQTMEIAVTCTHYAIKSCYFEKTPELLRGALDDAGDYISLTNFNSQLIIERTQTISDACAKTDTKHDASSAASAAANIGRAVQDLLSNSSEYILSAIDDALYAMEGEPNQKIIMSEIEDELRRIISECP